MEEHLARINPNGNTVKDVPAKDFIEAFAKHLKKGNKIAIPEWGQYVKTACFKELAPYDNDCLYCLPGLHAQEGRCQRHAQALRYRCQTWSLQASPALRRRKEHPLLHQPARYRWNYRFREPPG